MNKISETEYRLLFVNAARVTELQTLGLTVTEKEPGVFTASKREIEKLCAEIPWLYIPTAELKSQDIQNSKDCARAFIARKLVVPAGKLDNDFFLAVFALKPENIRQLCSDHPGIPIEEKRLSEFVADHIELKRWCLKNPDVLKPICERYRSVKIK